MGYFEHLWSTITIPWEIAKVFDAMKDIFDAFPVAVKFAFTGCFALACLFAIFRMLT